MTECIAILKDKFGRLEYKQELIRCKDCKYFISSKGYFNQGSPQCSKLDTIAGWISEDSYCSNAVRKNDTYED